MSVRCIALFIIISQFLFLFQTGYSQPKLAQESSGLRGYISMNVAEAPDGFGYGISWYSGVWPLLDKPIANFQIGLPSSWIIPKNTGVTTCLCPPNSLARQLQWCCPGGRDLCQDVFQTLEGGLGYWVSNQRPTAAPKFRMNGTPNCYTSEISSTGWGFTRPDPLGCNQMGIAQLSNSLLIPPDGLTFQPGTNGELLGSAWMALPLTDFKGYYHLTTKFVENDNLCLEGNKVAQGSSLNGAAFMAKRSMATGELWKFIPLGNGYYRMTTRFLEQQDLYLEGNNVAAGASLGGAAFMAKWSNATGQMWKLIPDGKGYYWLTNKFLESQNKCLEGNKVAAGSSLGGAAFMAPRTSTGQLWKLIPEVVNNTIPTGDKSWTLFLSTSNFKGPVAFYIPETWSDVSINYHDDAGRGLDSREGKMAGGAMEINTVPYFKATDGGRIFSRIPGLRFPVDRNGNTVLMQDVMMYSMNALYGPLMKSFTGGEQSTGKFKTSESFRPKCTVNAINLSQGPDNANFILTGINDIVETTMIGSNENSFGLKWKKGAASDGRFPEYFQQNGNSMKAVTTTEVPASTSLTTQNFEAVHPGQSFTSPKPGDTCYAKPGPNAGPFVIILSDSTKVTYAWYRFVDQPALQRLKLSTSEKQRLQSIVEQIHRNWKITGEYMPAPTQGRLATLDNAILVTPPPNMLYGYVPIVIRQDPR